MFLGGFMKDQCLTSSFPETQINPYLPKQITQQLPQLICYRFGELPDSDMITTHVEDYVAPNKLYRFCDNSLEMTFAQIPTTAGTTNTDIPEFQTFSANWLQQESKTQDGANVLGKSHTLQLEEELLTIPAVTATKPNLAYYDAQLIEENDIIDFQTEVCLPINRVQLGKNYQHGYLSHPDLGGGYYLEKHDTPHFWCHTSPQAQVIYCSLSKQHSSNIKSQRFTFHSVKGFIFLVGSFTVMAY